MKSLDDKALALAFQAGAEAAFDEIVTRFQGRVYAVAYRVLGNREDALDVAQEVFLKVHRKIGSWQPTGGFLPWVLRMANHNIDQLRRRKRYGATARRGLYPRPKGAAVSGLHEYQHRVRAREVGAGRKAFPSCRPHSARSSSCATTKGCNSGNRR